LIIHLIRNIECELCKQPLKERFRIKGRVINTLEIQRPENNYLILEGVNREKSENKYLYVIHMKDKQIIKMGRSNDADVRITDISVSRSHAFLKLYEGTFYIEDNHSKFGTLIQIPENFLVFPNRQLALQLGRTFVIFSMRKTCMALLRCYK
jgi:FHA domain